MLRVSSLASRVGLVSILVAALGFSGSCRPSHLFQETVLRWIALLVLGVALGVAAAWGFQFASPSASPSARDNVRDDRSGQTQAAGADPAPEKRSVFALGTLEPRDGVIQISSPLAGTRVQKVPGSAGQQVEAGEVLIELDRAAAELELALAQAQRKQAAQRQQAETDAAQQRLALTDLAVKQAQQSREVELDAQQKQLRVAEDKLKQTQDALQRLQSVQRVPANMPDPQLDQQRSVVQLATAERDAAQAAVRRVEQSLDFAMEKAQAEQRAASQTLESTKQSLALEALEPQVKMAEQKLARTKVIAPSGGTILSVLTHAGELVSAQPLVQLADLSSLVCQAEVDVADIFLLRENQPAWITCRAFPSAKIHARVEHIRNRAGPATLHPLDPRQAADRTIATVILQIDRDELMRQLRTAARGAPVALIGLQVDVEIPL
jgi:HlyD family secretion protein